MPAGLALPPDPLESPVEPGAPASFADGRYQTTGLLRRATGTHSYLGVDEETGEPVVIKTIQLEQFPAGTIMRLEHEATILRQVASTSLAPVVYVGREVGVIALVSRWLPGQSLQSRIKSRPLDVASLLTVGEALLRGLHDLHRHRVLHRNIRPSNMLVEGANQVTRATVIDFGPPPVIEADAGQRDQWLEIANYLSPEQAGLLDHDVGEASDLYAAGAVLFHCAAGRPPF